jgi:hypothetical protein
MREEPGSLAGKVAELLGSPRWSPELAGPASDIEIDAAERELGVEFPRSYKAFLRCFGAARIQSLDLFGLSRNRLWGDVVLMNQLMVPPLPPPCVMVGRDDKNRVYCLDTSSRDAEGEYPVLVFHKRGAGVRVAPTFLAFLVRLSLG